MGRRRVDFSGDLFGEDGLSASREASSQDSASAVGVGDSIPAQNVRLIESPLVTESLTWLVGEIKELGSLLSADRAAEYVAILRAFTMFRQHHEPEPLHEDLVRAVCGDETDPFAESTFKTDLRQLKDWGLVTERIEKERLRGYRDTRRTKFRYRLCEEAVRFVEWLGSQRDFAQEALGG